MTPNLRAKRPLAILALTATLAAGTPAQAASELFMPELSADKVQEISNLARDSLGLVLLPDGNRIPPETPAERQTPLIPDELARTAVDLGVASGFADWCDIEWQESNYRKFIGEQRELGRSDKVMAYLGLVHGVTMSLMKPTDGACSASERTAVGDFFERRWR